jgi:hypothetical protein
MLGKLVEIHLWCGLVIRRLFVPRLGDPLGFIHFSAIQMET